MSTRTFILVCFSWCFLVAVSQPVHENPGFAYRISVSALNVLSEALWRTLKKDFDLQPHMIPDQYASDSMASYSVRNIRFQLSTVPRSNVSFQPPNGVTWTLWKIGFSFACNWSYDRQVFFIRESDKGSSSVSVSGLSIVIKAILGRNDNELPAISMTKCSASVEKVSLEIEGSYYQKIYNMMFRNDLVKSEIKKKTIRATCDLVRMAFMKLNNEVLANMPAKYPIFSKMGYSDLIFDYGLTAPPFVTESHVEVNHRGMFRLVGDPVGRLGLLKAPKLSMPPSKYMVSTSKTNYPFRTLSDSIMRSNFSSFYLTRTSLPSIFESSLDTTCDNNQSICIGTFVSEISKRYPNKSMNMMIKLTTRPDLIINKNSLTITAGLRTSFILVEPLEARTETLLLDVSISLTGTEYLVNNNTLVGKLTAAKVLFTSASSPVINNNSSTLLKRLNQKAEYVLTRLIPRINEWLSVGIELPTKFPQFGFQAVWPQLKLIPGNIIYNVDLALL